MKFILLPCVYLLFNQTLALAQSTTVVDSLEKQLTKDSAYIFRPKPAKPYLRVENKSSFISKEPVNLAGFLAGATFYEKHVFCAGYYILNRRTQKAIELIDENKVTTREYLKLNYFVFSYQYVLINKKYLQINTPFELGYGLYKTRTTDIKDNFITESKGEIVPLSAGLQFIFKPIKWLGISCIGGYRLVLQERNTTLNFTGLFYSFGLWVDARYLYRNTLYFNKKRKYRKALAQL
jgi:hypothetical protein